MSPSTPRKGQNEKKSLSGLSFAFPMQLPRAGTGAGNDTKPSADTNRRKA